MCFTVTLDLVCRYKVSVQAKFRFLSIRLCLSSKGLSSYEPCLFLGQVLVKAPFLQPRLVCLLPTKVLVSKARKTPREAYETNEAEKPYELSIAFIVSGRVKPMSI
jgi:hypothetical protein